jgi:DNA repair photolyase
MIVREIESAGSITRSGMKELDYCLNPYLGCSHRCLYCYAIDMTYDREASENWGDVVLVRKNIDRRLASDIKGIKRGIVGISTITDPYQPAEARYRLTGKCLQILLKNGFRVTVQTKSPLVRLDFPLLSKYAHMADLGMTITTLDRSRSLRFETRTPSPEARVSALREASKAGIPTWIYYGPIIKGFNDSQEEIRNIVSTASSTS